MYIGCYCRGTNRYADERLNFRLRAAFSRGNDSKPSSGLVFAMFAMGIVRKLTDVSAWKTGSGDRITETTNVSHIYDHNECTCIQCARLILLNSYKMKYVVIYHVDL